MFESLTDKLQAVFDKLGSKGKLTEADVNAAMREVRLALLEADVNFKVVKDFVAAVKERAVGAEVMSSLTPAQQVVKIVHEELIALLGNAAPLNLSGPPPNVIMLVGLQGAGKTTMAAKLALRLRKNGQRPLLVAGDIYRPAAIQQLQILGNQIDVPVYSEGTEVAASTIAKNALRQAREYLHNASAQIREDLGPEFDDLAQPLGELNKLRGMSPRAAITKHLLDGDDSIFTGNFGDPAAPSGPSPAVPPVAPAAPEITPGPVAPAAGPAAGAPESGSAAPRFDPDAT